MSSPNRCAIVAGTVVFVIHLVLAVALFVSVHIGHKAQTEFAWFYFMKLDYPISEFAWNYLATTQPFEALRDWGYTWGSGPNLRALFIHGLIGGAQWFLIGAALGFFFWPRKGYLALRKISEVQHYGQNRSLRSLGRRQSAAAFNFTLNVI